jgi:hypothetical protein
VIKCDYREQPLFALHIAVGALLTTFCVLALYRTVRRFGVLGKGRCVGFNENRGFEVIVLDVAFIFSSKFGGRWVQPVADLGFSGGGMVWGTRGRVREGGTPSRRGSGGLAPGKCFANRRRKYAFRGHV